MCFFHISDDVPLCCVHYIVCILAKKGIRITMIVIHILLIN